MPELASHVNVLVFIQAKPNHPANASDQCQGVLLEPLITKRNVGSMPRQHPYLHWHTRVRCLSRF